MKNMMTILGIFNLFATIAHGQVTNTPGEQYREYAVTLSLDGKISKVMLHVNTDLRIDEEGDADIPGHGHYNYKVTGSVLDYGQTCSFDVLLAQGALKKESTEEILKSKKDRSDELKLCSGLRITLESVRVLMMDATATTTVYAPNLEQPFGQGVMMSNGLKTVPTSIPSDPNRIKVLDRKDHF